MNGRPLPHQECYGPGTPDPTTSRDSDFSDFARAALEHHQDISQVVFKLKIRRVYTKTNCEGNCREESNLF